MPKVLDPHTDTVPLASQALPMLRARLARGGTYWIKVGKTAPCLTCGVTKELRYGHCFDCAKAADPGE